MSYLAGPRRPSAAFRPRLFLPAPSDPERNYPESLGAKYLTISTAPLIFLLLLYPCSTSANSRVGVVGIPGSVHDFTNALASFSDGMGSKGAQSDRCRFCHMPRNHSRANYGDTGILWNEQANTRSSWRVYGSDPTMLDWIDGTVEPAPSGSSKVCLSCHDGSTAGNQSDGRTAGSSAPPAGNALGYRSSVTIGGTSGGLTNNHPISITYAWTRDSQLHNPAYAVMGDGRSVQGLLEDGRVECATCHDVHTSNLTANRALLRTASTGASISGSGGDGLCMVCHDK